MASKKKSDKKAPRPPKINIDARLPRPKPVAWKSTQALLEEALQYPLYGCWIDAEWRARSGLARVVVARSQAPGLVLFGVYLVDYYCKGLKNCDTKTGVSEKAFLARLDLLCGAPAPCDPALAHEIIYGSIEYGKRCGFSPHGDFAQARLVLDPPGAYEPTGQVEFGHKGKPLYINGPYDDPEQDITILNRKLGEGNYDFLVGLGEGDEPDDEILSNLDEDALPGKTLEQ